MDYVFLTGASSGVGRELAVYLSENYNLIINGRNEDRLSETKSLCRNEVLIWPYDLTQTASLEEDLSRWLKSKELCITSFVHCAGLMKMVPVRSVDSKVLFDTFSTNVFAPELITKVLASRKINSRNLISVVFISSNISNRGAAAFSVYGSSKAALDGLMRNLSIELAPGIRVNSVLPGGMITEMTKDLFADENVKKQFEMNYPLGIGTPSDIAPVVEFLLSEKSRWITGQQIVVDGGRTIDITERNR
ncbi:MAG: SDR family oxidoreductase [Saccharofermentans sp.]|nr:SDR family oxidoreductase [Saccharofermentans sp.]